MTVPRLQSLFERRLRLFEVDDVDLVAVTEDVRGHLGVPETGLVTKVDTRFQHFAHGYRHVMLQRLDLEAASDQVKF